MLLSINDAGHPVVVVQLGTVAAPPAPPVAPPRMPSPRFNRASPPPPPPPPASARTALLAPPQVAWAVAVQITAEAPPPPPPGPPSEPPRRKHVIGLQPLPFPPDALPLVLETLPPDTDWPAHPPIRVMDVLGVTGTLAVKPAPAPPDGTLASRLDPPFPPAPPATVTTA
ncbi:MAG TPA: hypothetical protein DCQ30_02465 [Acidimicrobiaceae bacterium]|nr:hypothetical protein [Acidimicrobiaceae bacterium]